MSTSTSIINNNNDEEHNRGTTTSRQQDGEEQQLFGNFTRSAQTVFGNTGRAISNFLPNPPMSLPFIQPKKFALPDKNVASQVLMYRQLLHTNCRPGLKLSRPYQNTAAQRAVLHMPWWEQGILETNKMVISYDNLVVRLWMHGAIMPFADLLGTPVETYINEDGLPPIPHEYWVERLGFQQPDPVTDFRSGGVLSLAMMVHMVESCLPTVKRFHSPDGDASVLPFGITCINVTDMMAKFLMLAKSTDKMEALMSQKPFWRMFADPNAILALQELSMQMLCNVVVEMNRERCISSSKNNNNTTAAASNSMMPGGSNDNTNRPVSVFDFAEILERTERRVRDDLLGAGPSTVEELRSIAASLATKYQHQLEEKERKAGIHMANMNNNSNRNNPVQNAVAGASNIAGSAVAGASNIAGSAVAGASNIAGSAVAGATNMAAGMFEKIKGAKLPNPLARNQQQQSNNNTDTVPSPTIVDIPPRDAAVTSQRPMVDLLSGNNEGDTPTIGDDWMGVSKDDFPSYPPTNVTNATSSPPFHFSIDDEEDIL